MNTVWQFKSVRTRMLAYVLPVVLAGVGVLAVLSVTRATSNQRNAAYASLRNLSVSVSSQWAGQIEAKMQLARSVAAAAAATGVIGAGPAVTKQFLTAEDETDPTAQHLALVLPQRSLDDPIPGVVHVGKKVEYDPQPYRLDASLVEAMLAHPTDVVTEPSLYRGQAVAEIAAPIFGADGKVAGATEVAGDLSVMFGKLAAQKIDKTGYILAVGGNGTFVLSPRARMDGRASLASLASLAQSEHNPDLLAVAKAVKAGRPGQLTTTDPLTHKNVVLTWSPVGSAKWAVITSVPTGTVLASANALKTTLIIVALLVIAILALCLVVASHRLAKPIGTVAQAAERLSEGDVDISLDLHGEDEIGRLAEAFRRNVAYLREQATVAERIAEGDLTVDPTPRSERDLLGHALVTLEGNLRSLVGLVSSSAQGVAGASTQMAATSQDADRATGDVARAVGDVAAGAERQVQMVESARQTAEAVAQASEESARQARDTATVAAEARRVAQGGVSAADQAHAAMQLVRDSSQTVTDTIGELATKSDQIGAIVQTITGIAEQTNLLALNAAIEAARAGEQGRGFAVVAEEVRKLAEDSQRAAGEIAQLIQTMQAETERAVAVVQRGAEQTASGAATVEQTREAFVQIGSSVEDISARIERIATAASEVAVAAQSMQMHMADVAAVAEQSSASTEEVSASTQETAASTQEIADSARQLASTATELELVVSQFHLTA
jgi:methyl-accepting chemotaxis protein